jgi:hypothetical protein
MLRKIVPFIQLPAAGTPRDYKLDFAITRLWVLAAYELHDLV